MVPEGVPLGCGDRKDGLQYVRKKGWLGNVGPISAKSWWEGEEGSGKRLWPLELRKAQCSSYKEEADRAGG